MTAETVLARLGCLVRAGETASDSHMATISVHVQVQRDHLQRLAFVRRPLIAIAEMIWNGLDADATEVSVTILPDLTGGIREIQISDNGTGIAHGAAVDAFKNLGGSWKSTARKSKGERRLLHGRGGKGRFRAFALGRLVTWRTVADTLGRRVAFDVTGNTDNLGTFEISDPVATDEPTGTRVLISEIPSTVTNLTGPAALQGIAEEFAIYLRKYEQARVVYDGMNVDPGVLEENDVTYPLSPVAGKDGSSLSVELEVVEWKMKTDRHLFLCDSDGFTLHRLAPGIVAPGFNFTAYLRSDFLRQQDDVGLLDLEEPTDALAPILEEARQQLRAHFRGRSSAAARELVADWKEKKVYPFEGEAKDPIENARRQVFDVVALNVSEYLPDFAASSNPKSQRLSFRLLREALEDSPEAVRRIIAEVLDLPAEKKEELAALLESTTLSSIIASSKMVGDRLHFLSGLELMVFHTDVKKLVKERKHLHKILERETWVFGEEYNLSASDKSLDEVLRKHLAAKGVEATLDVAPVLRLDGKEGIIDLMLSRTIRQAHADEHEHLIVELKRPTYTIDSKALQQVKDYAFAVAEDSRFADTKTRWAFWVVSGEMNADVRHEATQQHRPQGLAIDTPNVKIWVKTWAQVIDSAKARMRFFQEALQFEVTEGSTLTHLREMYDAFLPDALREKQAS